MVCLSRRDRSGNVTLCVPHEAFFRFNLNIGGKYFSRHLTLVGTRPLVHVPWSTHARTHARTHAPCPFTGSVLSTTVSAMFLFKVCYDA